jgi:hypothetical protein
MYDFQSDFFDILFYLIFMISCFYSYYSIIFWFAYVSSTLCPNFIIVCIYLLCFFFITKIVHALASTAPLKGHTSVKNNFN